MSSQEANYHLSRSLIYHEDGEGIWRLYVGRDIEQYKTVLEKAQNVGGQSYNLLLPKEGKGLWLEIKGTRGTVYHMFNSHLLLMVVLRSLWELGCHNLEIEKGLRIQHGEPLQHKDGRWGYAERIVWYEGDDIVILKLWRDTLPLPMPMQFEQ